MVTTTFTPPTRPVMRYYGGKWRIAEWIISFLPPHDTYVEPFGGAASVMLRKPPARVDVYNDLDSEVVNLFRVLRDPVESERLRELLELTPFSREDFDETYGPPSGDRVEDARRLLLRAWGGFGATSMVRDKTGFRSVDSANGPHTTRLWARWPEQVPLICGRLRNVCIEHRPAAEVIAMHDAPTTLIYADPPYLLSTRNPRSARRDGDYAHEMTAEEHRELAAILHAVRGMVVLSGYPSPLYDEELYSTWERHERAAVANGGAARREVLWLNDAAAEAAERARHQMSLL